MENIQRQIARLPEHRGLIEALVRPFVRMTPAGRPEAATQSYVGGHPFIPAGMDRASVWPVDGAGAPLLFLAQVNFAEVPPLPGFPTEGMMQWFVGTDETYGLTFDDTSGLVGFAVRWWTAADLTVAAAAGPDAPVEVLPDSPLRDPGPVRIGFAREDGLPSLTEMYDARWSEIEAAAEAIKASLPAGTELNEVWDEPAPGETAFGSGDRIGGYPFFTQADPREGSGRAETLLVQFHSSGGFTDWGDGGSAQLFGDPAALARGEVLSCWWDWACY